MPKRSKDTYAILGSTDPVSTRLDGGADVRVWCGI